MVFNKKGQGSLEYILIIGGAILVAAIVLALVLGAAQEPNIGGTAGAAVNETYCNQWNGTTQSECEQDLVIMGKNPKSTCVWSDDDKKCHAQ